MLCFLVSNLLVLLIILERKRESFAVDERKGGG
jgi:hypothetical protein